MRFTCRSRLRYIDDDDDSDMYLPRDHLPALLQDPMIDQTARDFL